ncbi:MAG: sulfotransferase [Leptolyngbyaceae cyanobacterium]
MRKVLFILGTAHSGSTLLSLMLSSHHKIFALGELSNLPDFHKKDRSICDICEGKCSFWDTQFSSEELNRLTDCLVNQRLHKYIPLKVERQVRSLIGRDQIFRPYTKIFSKLPDSVQVLIDSTKTVWWIEKQLQLPEFRPNGGLKPKLLHLVKDGRAVIASQIRRRPNSDIEKLSHKWLQRVTKSQALFESFPQADRLCIAYEALATEPEKTLREICNFLDLDFTPKLLPYWESEHHFISGNTGTRSLIQKYRRQESPSDTDSIHQKQNSSSAKDFKYYADDVGFQIKLDVRWKSELSPEQIQAFERIAGEVNRPYAQH